MKVTSFSSRHSGRVAAVFLVWLGLAVAVGSTGVLKGLPRPVVPAFVVTATILFTLAASRGGWFAARFASLSLKALLVPHLVRFVGGYFLWLHAQGRLPAEFASRAGWGDIVAAAGVLVLLAWPAGAGFRRAVWVWNGFGLLDLLLAVGTAVWLNAARPGSMVEIVTLPLALLPLFFVPTMLGLHLLTFARLRREEVAAPVPAGA